MKLIGYAVPFFFVLIAVGLLAERLRDKLRIWFMPTCWHPADVAAQFAVYMALGLFVLGAGRENRPRALKLEWLRLVLKMPLMWLAPVAGLWPASATGWIGLYLSRNRITRLAGC